MLNKFYLSFNNVEIIKYTDFQLNLKHRLNKVIKDVSDIFIKRKNGKDVVLISLDEYNALTETSYLLTDKTGMFL